MGAWARRIRGAVGMGACWAVAWAAAGVGIGASSLLFPRLDWATFFRVFDAPLPALALPGFIGGVLFSLLLGVAARRRRFSELSVGAFAAGGAGAGLLLSLVPMTLFRLGLATTTNSPAELWSATVIVGVPFTILSALSAAGSLALARRAEQPRGHSSDATRRDIAAGRQPPLPGRGYPGLGVLQARLEREGRHQEQRP